MEIQGKVIAVLPLASGEGKNGTWRSQDYVLETMEQYPKKVCFNLFGNKIEQFPIAIDDIITVSFDIESREWNGRWFTTIRAWKVDKSTAPVDSTQTSPISNMETFTPEATDDGSGLPF